MLFCPGTDGKDPQKLLVKTHLPLPVVGHSSENTNWKYFRPVVTQLQTRQRQIRNVPNCTLSICVFLKIFIYVSVCLLIFISHTCGSQKSVSVNPELALQLIGSHYMWVLGATPSFLQGHQVLLVAEPSPQSTLYILYCFPID